MNYFNQDQQEYMRLKAIVRSCEGDLYKEFAWWVAERLELRCDPSRPLQDAEFARLRQKISGHVRRSEKYDRLSAAISHAVEDYGS